MIDAAAQGVNLPPKEWWEWIVMRTRNQGLLLAGLMLATVAQPIRAQDAGTQDVTWAPDAIPSVIRPTPDTTQNAWAAFARYNPAPSEDQHLQDRILDGAIDIHAHYGPDTYNRQWDVFEIAARAQERGMRGLVIKSHWTESATVANLARRYAAPGLEVFGSLSLNASVGGVNPMAVRAFAEIDGHYGKVVWMPTHDSEHEVLTNGDVRPYVRVSQDGVLLPQVFEVLDLIAQYDLTLATGHVSADEMLQIMHAARERGINRIIVTHPGLGPQYTDPSIEQLQEAAAMGGYAEVVANTLYSEPSRSAKIAMIRALGPEHCIISSDSGLVGTPNHADAMVLTANILREAGFTEDELDLMFKTNPARVLGLE